LIIIFNKLKYINIQLIVSIFDLIRVIDDFFFGELVTDGIDTNFYIFNVIPIMVKCQTIVFALAIHHILSKFPYLKKVTENKIGLTLGCYLLSSIQLLGVHSVH